MAEVHRRRGAPAVSAAATIVFCGLLEAAAPALAVPIRGYGACGSACPNPVVSVPRCNGPEPAFGPYRPFDEFKPFTLRSRCRELERTVRPSVKADRAGQVRRATTPDLHRGSPFTGLSGSPHAFGPIFRQRSHFYSPGQ